MAEQNKVKNEEEIQKEKLNEDKYQMYNQSFNQNESFQILNKMSSSVADLAKQSVQEQVKLFITQYNSNFKSIMQSQIKSIVKHEIQKQIQEFHQMIDSIYFKNSEVQIKIEKIVQQQVKKQFAEYLIKSKNQQQQEQQPTQQEQINESRKSSQKSTKKQKDKENQIELYQKQQIVRRQKQNRNEIKANEIDKQYEKCSSQNSRKIVQKSANQEIKKIQYKDLLSQNSLKKDFQENKKVLAQTIVSNQTIQSNQIQSVQCNKDPSDYFQVNRSKENQDEIHNQSVQQIIEQHIQLVNKQYQTYDAKVVQAQEISQKDNADSSDFSHFKQVKQRKKSPFMLSCKRKMISPSPSSRPNFNYRNKFNE